jgi:hypothetical protein
MKRIVTILVSIYGLTSANAQRADTTKKTVVVTSAFKPTVKPAAKINFTAATPVIDSTRLDLKYNVPAQNLFFSYQPEALKPLALSLDTTTNWTNDNYVKAGFGNYKTPFVQAGFSFGDGEHSLLNVHAKHISSKGSRPFQQYSRSNADLIGIFNTAGTNEWRGSVGFDNSTQYFYGYQPDTLKFNKDDLRQRLNTFRGGVGVRNKEQNAYGISYNPSFSFNMFGDNRSAREMNLLLVAPITKSFGKAFAINLGLTADITRLKLKNEAIKNNLYYLTPSIQFKTPNLVFTGGVNPTWDNQVFSVLPNFTVVAKLSQEENFMLQAGWVGYVNKNTYQSFASYNPWIQQPTSLLNTRVREQYAGFKGSLTNHFSYTGRVSLMKFSNAALFINDTASGRTFVPVFEPSMKAFKIHGEVGYTMQEKFSLLAGVDIINYKALEINDKAYGLLPFQLNGSLRWQLMKDLHVKADAFFFGGSQYREKGGKSSKLNPAVDLNTGVEFTIMPKLNLWVQFNNLLNNRYQRWHQYEVLGFNVLGGIVYSFSQNR